MYLFELYYVFGVMYSVGRYRPFKDPPWRIGSPPFQNHFFSRHRYSKRYVLNIARAFEQSLFKIVYEPTRKNKQAAASRNSICEEKELVRLRRR